MRKWSGLRGCRGLTCVPEKGHVEVLTVPTPAAAVLHNVAIFGDGLYGGERVTMRS